MQDQSERAAAGGTAGGRRVLSSVERLPADVRDAVDAAIEGGATIDEITANIRARGGGCSRAAVGRYTKQLRELVSRQREVNRCIETWVRELGERAEGRTGLITIEALRSLAMLSVAELGKDGERVETEELARLALIARRIEGAGRLCAARERALAKAAAGTGRRPGPAGRKAGLSPEAVAAIRQAIEGKAPS